MSFGLREALRRSRQSSVRNPARNRARHALGFTLIELMIVIVIIGILATLATGAYTSMIDRARVVQAIGDIRAISLDVDDYWMRTGEYPATLALVGEDDRRDPWDRPYVYSPIGANGYKPRKDKKLKPISSDYDLYSQGADGDSKEALTAKASRDDIVRAANGGYIGLGENY